MTNNLNPGAYADDVYLLHVPDATQQIDLLGKYIRNGTIEQLEQQYGSREELALAEAANLSELVTVPCAVYKNGQKFATADRGAVTVTS